MKHQFYLVFSFSYLTEVIFKVLLRVLKFHVFNWLRIHQIPQAVLGVWVVLIFGPLGSGFHVSDVLISVVDSLINYHVMRLIYLISSFLATKVKYLLCLLLLVAFLSFLHTIILRVRP